MKSKSLTIKESGLKRSFASSRRFVVIIAGIHCIEICDFLAMEIKSSLWSQEIERSRIPEDCLSEEVIVGIDEAGRGPVLGMIDQYIRM